MTITDGTIEAVITKSIGTLPGTITAFSGTFDDNGYPINLYTGNGDMEWHICDGTHGTPDLTGRFIMQKSDTHPVGERGGEEQHKLTEEELPHLTGSAGRFHAYYSDFSSSGILSSTKYNSYMVRRYEDGDRSNAANINIELGNDKPHNNLPPYYALAFIMKLKPGD